jgi:uncharacterized protein YuzE
MKIQFDPEVDALYLRLSESAISDSESMGEDIVYDFDDQNQVVGIELLRVTANLSHLAVIPLPFQKIEQQVEFLQFLETIADTELKAKLMFARQVLQNQTLALQRI